MQKKLFADLGLSPEILKAVAKMGFEEASPIQSETIPKLMQGQDVVGLSQTGSGKTAAFAIPAIEKVDATKRVPQVLMLCPTRELAIQVAEEVAKLAVFKRGVRELPIYGGSAYDRQLRGLRDGAQIIIGTPGRIIDHLERGSLRLDKLAMVVLDEADRMLDMGFRDDIEAILKQAPSDRQTVFFSATLPPPIQQLIKRYARQPVNVRIEAQQMTAPAIDQVYYEVDRRSKLEVLCRLLDLQDIKYALIFCATKMMVDELADHLAARGYLCDKLHGGISQATRERVMAKFRRRGIEILVATDVAARGLDVDDIEVVFNYDLPQDAEDYVHRIGRTGRAGRSGRAITFVAGREIYKMQQIIRATKGRVQREKVPSAEQVEAKRTNQFQESLLELLESGDYERQDDMVDQLLELGYSPTEIASALMAILTKETTRETQPIVEEQRPVGRERFPDGGERRGSREHGGRRRQDDNRPTPPVSHEPGMTRLVLGLGRQVGLGPGDVVGVIANLADVSRENIGAIQVRDQETFVDVADECVHVVLKKLKGIKLKGRKLTIAPAA